MKLLFVTFLPQHLVGDNLTFPEESDEEQNE